MSDMTRLGFAINTMDSVKYMHYTHYFVHLTLIIDFK